MDFGAEYIRMWGYRDVKLKFNNSGRHIDKKAVCKWNSIKDPMLWLGMCGDYVAVAVLKKQRIELDSHFSHPQHLWQPTICNDVGFQILPPELTLIHQCWFAMCAHFTYNSWKPHLAITQAPLIYTASVCTSTNLPSFLSHFTRSLLYSHLYISLHFDSFHSLNLFPSIS